MRSRGVRALLMGGQACVFYGAAEFSRDTDFVILADAANLARLRAALADLRAKPIAVPPFEAKYLRRGHALHFRCEHPEAPRMCVDSMSKMRGVDSFPKLWQRRTMIELGDETTCDLLSLPDLVQAKKTQHDKNWPMLRRLVEASYFEHRDRPNIAQKKFWLLELRTPVLLVELAQSTPSLTKQLTKKRPLLAHASSADLTLLEGALTIEETAEKQKDKAYWLPLFKELQSLRLKKC